MMAGGKLFKLLGKLYEATRLATAMVACPCMTSRSLTASGAHIEYIYEVYTGYIGEVMY